MKKIFAKERKKRENSRLVKKMKVKLIIDMKHTVEKNGRLIEKRIEN